jgi:hypothetical protein
MLRRVARYFPAFSMIAFLLRATPRDMPRHTEAKGADQAPRLREDEVDNEVLQAKLARCQARLLTMELTMELTIANLRHVLLRGNSLCYASYHRNDEDVPQCEASYCQPRA